MPPKGKRAAAKKEEPAAKAPAAKAPAAKAPAAKVDEPKVEKVEEKFEKTEEPIEEPIAKKAKTEEKKAEEVPSEQDVEMKTQEEEEAAKEKEKDAPLEKRQLIKDAIGFDTSETSLNVVPTTGGRVLLSLSDGGMQFLLAGARANTGMKANRYFYEVKIIEALTPSEAGHGGRGRVPMPRQLARVGFSTAGSSLILGDSDGGVCFDSEGFFLADKKRNQVSQKFGRDQIVGVLLNLDPKSPNANTISLFRNGERICDPQALPEQLKGKALFPHVCFRNVTVQVNFGPQCIKALPFKCRMLQEAAKADVEVMKSSTPKDGKYEVIFPVAFPDEGTFDWLDGFLEKNPQYVELSDRKILEWAVKSGIWRPKSNSWKNSNDKPDFNFGIPAMDDMSAHRTVNSIAPVVPRNYVVMEVMQNLVKADRQENLKRFSAPHFKKIAHVVMGEPSAGYKKLVHKKLLEEKQAKADAEWKVKKLEKERKKQIDKRQKQFAEMQKKALEAKQKEEEEAKKKDGEKKEDEVEESKDGSNEKKEDSKPEDEKKEDVEAGEDKGKEMEVDDKGDEEKNEEEESPPVVELTDEEKMVCFRPPTLNDLTNHVLSTSFSQFTIPTKDEGFDEIRFEWQGEEKSNEYLKKWVLEKKITSRIEDLQPSAWFKEKVAEFEKLYQEWQAKQKQFQETKKNVAKKEKRKDYDMMDDDDVRNEDEDDEIDAVDDLDIFSVEDVCDIGNGEPLFGSFASEDWALLNLRYELYLLVAGFKRDVDDPERVGIHESHFFFYYSRYFKKQLNPKQYGKDSIEGLVKLVKDTVAMDPTGNVLKLVGSHESESAGTFLKLTEENRRERQRRIDAGDETARLNFTSILQQQKQVQKGGVHTVPPPNKDFTGYVPAVQPPRPSSSWQNQGNSQWQPGGSRGGGGGGKGGGRWQQQTYAPRNPNYGQRSWR